MRPESTISAAQSRRRERSSDGGSLRYPRLLLWALTVLALAGLLALVVAGFVGSLPWQSVWTIATFVTTLGTAVGTIGLATYTYALARETARSAKTGRKSLEATWAMARAAERQLDELGRQRTILQAQADASGHAAAAAERARVDAASPLIFLRVELEAVWLQDEGTRREISRSDQFTRADLRRVTVGVDATFHFSNVGYSPALLSFGNLAGRMRIASALSPAAVTLAPGEDHLDQYTEHFEAATATAGVLRNIAVTYDSLLHGSMFDRVQWKGWITPLEEQDGVLRLRRSHILNGSVQVFREYPNLDLPEEMSTVRARLQAQD